VEIFEKLGPAFPPPPGPGRHPHSDQRPKWNNTGRPLYCPENVVPMMIPGRSPGRAGSALFRATCSSFQENEKNLFAGSWTVSQRKAHRKWADYLAYAILDLIVDTISLCWKESGSGSRTGGETSLRPRPPPAETPAAQREMLFLRKWCGPARVLSSWSAGAGADPGGTRIYLRAFTTTLSRFWTR